MVAEMVRSIQSARVAVGLVADMGNPVGMMGGKAEGTEDYWRIVRLGFASGGCGRYGC